MKTIIIFFTIIFYPIGCELVGFTITDGSALNLAKLFTAVLFWAVFSDIFSYYLKYKKIQST